MRTLLIVIIAGLAGCAGPAQRASDDCRAALTDAPGTRDYWNCVQEQTWAYEDQANARRHTAAPWLIVGMMGAALATPTPATTTTTVWWWR